MNKKTSFIKYEILTKTFLTLKDISVLMDCGLNKAGDYRKQYIKAKRLEKDYFNIMIPTSDFIKHFKIDVDMIRNNYELEQRIQGDLNA